MWVHRYVTAGAAWLSKVAKAGNVAGAKTREKFQLAVTNLTAKVSVTTTDVSMYIVLVRTWELLS